MIEMYKIHLYWYPVSIFKSDTEVVKKNIVPINKMDNISQ